MSKESSIKIGIVSLFFFICIVIFLIVYVNKKENHKIPEENNLPFQMQKVTDYTFFFSVVNTMNQYLNYNSSKNNIALYNFLNKEFITENKVDINNIFTKLEMYENHPSFKAKEMYYEENKQNNLYYVVGDIIVEEFEDSTTIKENAKFFVQIDYSNLSVSIYPLEKETNEIPIHNKEQSILLNEYNSMQSSALITDNYICNLYFSDYMEKLIDHVEDSYNLLEDDFKANHYANKEDYIHYINSKINTISLEIANCTLTNKNSQRVYTIRDANGNSFSFIENSIMNYKVNFRIK